MIAEENVQRPTLNIQRPIKENHGVERWTVFPTFDRRYILSGT
jgi:hypothetical protein